MDDLISRKALIERAVVAPIAGVFPEDNEPFYRKLVFLETIENLPSVQPERKRGHWDDENCSECGFYVHHGDMRNYCPCCGADMREGEPDA